MKEQEVSHERYAEQRRRLTELERDGNVDELIRELQSPVASGTFTLRVGAMFALERLRARDAATPIAKMLDDPAPKVRRLAIVALGRIGETDPAITQRLLAIADDVTEEEGARAHAIAALGHLGVRELLPRLSALLSSESRHVRNAAFYAALMFGGPEAEAAITPYTRGWNGRRRRRRVQRAVDRFNSRFRDGAAH